MSDDEKLSQKIIQAAEALEKWKAIEPYATKAASLVEEYGEIIDGVGTVFAVVGVVWGIYSKMEKAKADAAQQKAMVEQITQAVDGMIKRSTAEVTNLIRQEKVEDAITLVQTVQDGFRLDVLPYAKTYPVTGWDIVLVDNYRIKAREAIGKLHSLIEKHAQLGDGGTLIILYRHMHSVIQCKFAMDKWRHGEDPEVINQAVGEMQRLVQATITVNNGMRLMSDLSFSQGLVHFQVGGGGRPAFSQYKYYYKGQIQPGANKDMNVVSRAFVQARVTARDTVVGNDIGEWFTQALE